MAKKKMLKEGRGEREARSKRIEKKIEMGEQKRKGRK